MNISNGYILGDFILTLCFARAAVYLFIFFLSKMCTFSRRRLI